MTITTDQASDVRDLLTRKIRKKLTDYDPETSNMPFHTRLLGKDRMALFSFIQSINTTLGTSIFEEVAVILAKPTFKSAEAQYKNLNASIAATAQSEIQLIMDELTTSTRKPNKRDEIERIRKVAASGSLKKVKRPRVDVFLVAKNAAEYYVDLKTAKPNMEEFKGFKRKLLEWTANRLAENQAADVHTMIAIPYNPYEPAPYERWTLAGLFDLPEEIRVGEEFWDWIGGKNAYVELLGLFEEVGIQMRDEIDARFARFK